MGLSVSNSHVEKQDPSDEEENPIDDEENSSKAPTEPVLIDDSPQSKNQKSGKLDEVSRLLDEDGESNATDPIDDDKRA